MLDLRNVVILTYDEVSALLKFCGVVGLQSASQKARWQTFGVFELIERLRGLVPPGDDREEESGA